MCKIPSLVASNPMTKGLASKSSLATASAFVCKSGISKSTHNISPFTGDSIWILDSGASYNMTWDRYAFSTLFPIHSKPAITNDNGVSSPVVGIGTVSLSPPLFLHNNTLFIPSLNCNIIYNSK